MSADLSVPDLSVDLAPDNPRELRLANPVIAASGCFGYGQEYAGLIDVSRLGAFVSKGITPEPRSGNAMPRIVETPAGMLNAIGLQNPGIRGAARLRRMARKCRTAVRAEPPASTRSRGTRRRRARWRE